MTDRPLVITDKRGFVFTVGVGAVIVEKQLDGSPKRIVEICEDHVVCRSLRGSRLSRVKRRNLDRYWKTSR